MIGKILCIFLIFLCYLVLSAGLCYNCVGKNNPLHKFPLHVDRYDGSISIKIETEDDKYFFFLLFLIWPLLVLFYWIPIWLYKVFKFLANFFGWCIAKIFKL